MKLIAKIGPLNGLLAKVYWNYEDKEYSVRLWCGDKEYHPAEYFTSDRNDALNTAKDMVKRAAAQCWRA